MKNSSVFSVTRAVITATMAFVCFSGNQAAGQVPTPAAAAAPVRQTPVLSHSAGEVVRLYQAGINKDVIISYINDSPVPYSLGPDGIRYMRSLGAPDEITQAMMRNDQRLQGQQAAQQPVPTPPPGSNEPAAVSPSTQVATPSTPPPDITVITPYDGYPYADYGYGYDYGDYGPPIFLGGWGWMGRGYHGFHGRPGFGGSGFGGFHGGGGFQGGHGGGGGHR
jgi:hypothetical protein